MSKSEELQQVYSLSEDEAEIAQNLIENWHRGWGPVTRAFANEVGLTFNQALLVRTMWAASSVAAALRKNREHFQKWLDDFHDDDEPWK